jgi:uncharacterized protein YciI
MLSEMGDMKGSVMVMDFPSRKELNAYLAIEPYVVNRVWEKIKVIPCKVSPPFLK